MTSKFLFENILLLAVAVASGAMILWPYARRGVGGPFASPAEATLLINRQDALLLDVREAQAFAAGHVINAKNIPLAQLEARAGDLAKFKDKPVICHCENGSQTGAALAVLKKQGFNNLFNLRGGYAAWKQAGLPTEK